MATLHERWSGQKTTAEANFKMARKNLFDRLARQTKGGSPAEREQAKQKAIELNTMASGLTGGTN